MMQKLLFISHMPGLSGGAEKSLLEIVLSCKQNGYPSHVILPGEGDFSKRLDENTVPYSLLQYRWNTYTPDDGRDNGREERDALWLGDTLTAFKTTISAVNPDVIITNTVVAPWGMYVAKALGIPNIIMVREWIFREDEIKMAPESGEFMQLVNLCADWAIFNSYDTRDKYKGFFPEGNTSVMYPKVGVSDEMVRAHYRENTIGPKLSIMVAGRIIPSKNQIEAVKGIFRAIGMGVPIEKVLVIGVNGDDVYFRALQDEISGCGLEELIRIEEYTTDIFEVMNQYNIVIVPSKSEAFGRVTLEAQLFGRLVIGSRAGGTAELIEDEETGRLYEPKDIDDLAKAIEWVAKNPREAEKVSRQAMALQREKFLLADVTGPLRDAIDAVTGEKRKKARDRALDPLFAMMARSAGQEEEIERIRRSYSFRFGRAALAPFRQLKRLFGKSL